MLFARISRADGKWTEENLYMNIEELNKDTINPASAALVIVPFHISGKTYRERQSSLRNLAIDFQYASEGADIGLSWREMADIGDYFRRMGRRYGLLREFEENAIPC